jgi:two-component system, OmpR family, sensor histidine kinase BaeS
MLRTLRRRFVLSHILPLLIVIPLMGIATISLIEKHILTPTLLTELKSNAEVLSRFAADDQEIWQDPIYARRLLSQISGPANGHLMILDSAGSLLASSDSADAELLGTKIDHPGYTSAATGDISMEISSSRNLREDRVEALAPVINQQGKLLGFIKLSYEYSSFFRQLFQLRYLLTGILVVGLILGAGLGIALAINVSKPIQEVTETIDALAKGDRGEGLQETGSEEIRRLSRAVNTLFERLHSLEQARKRLLANLVHEIGRPLGALRMGIEALTYGADRNPEFFKELLAGMDQETARLQELLEDLSHLHEQALGVLELDRVDLDLHSWLPETLAPWHQAAIQNGLIWEMNIPQALPAVMGDPLRLNQVLGNLLSNAIKYTPAGGKIRVEAGQMNASIWLSVSDSGPGIDPEVQEAMFEPFVRGSQGTRFPQGMGLGLSIARELVEAHGGRLQLESETGAGAKFTIWLPLTP